MSVWLLAATVLLVALLLPFWLLVRAPPMDALVALELVSVVATLVLAALGLVSGLIFARFMERRV